MGPRTRGANASHVNPLIGAWASYSAREPAYRDLGEAAHVRNSGLTCGQAG